MSAAAQDAPLAPKVRFWNRSFMALVVAPDFPMADWFAALDHELARAPAFFRGRPLVVDLSAAGAKDGAVAAIVLDGFEARDLRLVGVEGVDASLLAGTPWARLARGLPGRDLAAPPQEGPAPDVRPAPGTLLIDRPVRSGQSIVFEAGDVTVIGAVASGAEVIAGGSIHVYGPLRGRAIAGLRSGPEARIFCARLEAELVGIDRLFRVAEHWGAPLHGRPAQVLCDRGALRLSALD
ncbi:septum site-determining protein MinC [Phenylobacterium hankyongense]|nr:septum site-determining protein MinC [Phenylobacterium hankyongense]